MYVVIDKNNKIVWINPAPEKQRLRPHEVWAWYDSSQYKIIKGFLPNYFDLIREGNFYRAVEWSLQRKYDEGVLNIPKTQLVEDGIIRNKTEQELINDDIITQEEIDQKNYIIKKQKIINFRMIIDAGEKEGLDMSEEIQQLQDIKNE